MHRHLNTNGVSRYAFVRKVREADICTTHTAECLLADDGTATGSRVPSFATAIDMARLAGFDMVMIPRKAP
jgi:predicted phosphoribosyltransferase